MATPPSLFLYADEQTARKFFSRNLVAPRSVLPGLPGQTPPLSFLRPDALFVTHLPVSAENRNLGEGLATEMRFPVTLEILPPKGTAAGRPVLLVAKGKDGISLEPGTWNDYDKKRHVGAFLSGEIPLSLVKAIWFETPEDTGRFAVPSPDFWCPAKKTKVFEKRFVGSSPFDDGGVLPEIPPEVAARFREAESRLRLREKTRAAMLLFVRGSRDWALGDWKTGMDKALQRFCGLPDATVAKAVPGWPGFPAESGNADILPWEPADDGAETGPERLYRSAFRFLAKQPYRVGGGGAKTAGDMVRELQAIADDEPTFRRELDAVSRFLAAPTDGPNLPQLLAGLKASPSICTALLMLSRTPNDVEELVNSLEIYRVGQKASRQALVLWGALNGLHGAPGRGFGKENETLWAFVENKAFAPDDPEVSLVPPPVAPKSVLKGKRLLDAHDLRKDEIIRGTAVFDFFKTQSVQWDKAPGDITAKIKAAIVEQGGPSALDAYSSLDLAKIVKKAAKSAKGTVSRAGWEAFVEELRRNGLNAMSVDAVAMCRDVLGDRDRFVRLWNADKAFWEDAYRKRRPKTKKVPKKAPTAKVEGVAGKGETADAGGWDGKAVENG